MQPNIITRSYLNPISINTIKKVQPQHYNKDGNKMRTIRTKVYKFNELSKQAKENAIEQHRNNGYDNQHYFDEITDSVKAMVELFGIETGRQWSDLKLGNIDDSIMELKGVRLYKYLVNNYYNELFTPKYLKCLDRELKCKQFICKLNTSHKGEKYTMLYSKQYKDNSCVLTGICYDNDILQPIYDFLKKPDKDTTFESLFNDVESAISKCYDNTEEWVNSDEFIKDEIEANELEFTKEGKRF